MYYVKRLVLLFGVFMLGYASHQGSWVSKSTTYIRDIPVIQSAEARIFPIRRNRRRTGVIQTPIPGERVVNLPKDQGKFFTTLILSDNDPEANSKLIFSFQSEIELKRLKKQTHFHVYAKDSRPYQNRLKASLGSELPAILIQTPKGKVLYKASGKNLPNAKTLAEEVYKCFRPFRPFRPRPRPNPEPNPTPKPSPPPNDDSELPQVPDLRPNTPQVPVPNESTTNPMLWLLPLIAGGAGIANEFKNDMV